MCPEPHASAAISAQRQRLHRSRPKPVLMKTSQVRQQEEGVRQERGFVACSPRSVGSSRLARRSKWSQTPRTKNGPRGWKDKANLLSVFESSLSVNILPTRGTSLWLRSDAADWNNRTLRSLLSTLAVRSRAITVAETPKNEGNMRDGHWLSCTQTKVDGAGR